MPGSGYGRVRRIAGIPLWVPVPVNFMTPNGVKTGHNGVIMIRILLPLMVAAALYFAPLFNESISGSFSGDAERPIAGSYFVGDTVGCVMNQNFSIKDECEPKDGMKGLAIAGAMGVSAIAGVLGVLGLLPFVGRLTSLVTTIAGVASIGAIAYFAMNIMGQEGVTLAWGTYVAGGLGLLTLISGLSGMRGG